jgi:hypothetical protein
VQNMFFKISLKNRINLFSFKLLQTRNPTYRLLTYELFEIFRVVIKCRASFLKKILHEIKFRNRKKYIIKCDSRVIIFRSNLKD